jgi:hypothetical protein
MAGRQPPAESPKAYADMAARPAVWQWVARDLLAAANALHAHRRGPGPRKRRSRSDSPSETSPAPILLLYGMALENLLKGVLIAQGTPATVRGRLNRKLKTHDLEKLWSMAGLPADKKVKTLLSALAWAVETGGRYPVGLHPSATSMRHLAVGITPVEEFIALFDTAEEALRRSYADGPFQRTNLLQWGV